MWLAELKIDSPTKGENCHYSYSIRLLCQHIQYWYTIRVWKTNCSSEDLGPVTSHLYSPNSIKSLFGVRCLSLLWYPEQCYLGGKLIKIENGVQKRTSNRSLFFYKTVIPIWNIGSKSSHFQFWHEFTARTGSEEPPTNGTKRRLRTDRFLSSCKFITNLMNTSRFPKRTGNYSWTLAPNTPSCIWHPKTNLKQKTVKTNSRKMLKGGFFSWPSSGTLFSK